MAPPIFLGTFKGNFRSPVSVRNFVAENVPCTKGPVPQEWTHAIYAKLRPYGVEPAVIVAGLKLARADGYVFDDPTVPNFSISPVLNGPINTGPKMGHQARVRSKRANMWWKRLSGNTKKHS
jgi:hypothetical protein